MGARSTYQAADSATSAVRAWSLGFRRACPLAWEGLWPLQVGAWVALEPSRKQEPPLSSSDEGGKRGGPEESVIH